MGPDVVRVPEPQLHFDFNRPVVTGDLRQPDSRAQERWPEVYHLEMECFFHQRLLNLLLLHPWTEVCQARDANRGIRRARCGQFGDRVAPGVTVIALAAIWTERVGVGCVLR